MKLAPMIMILVLLQVVIMFYTGAYSETSYDLDPYNSSSIVNNTNPSIMQFIADPTPWAGADFLIFLAGIVGVVSLITTGLFVVTKSDTILFFPVFTSFLSFGAIPLISLYKVFMAHSSIFGCVSLEPCAVAIMIYMASAGLIAIFYVLVVLGWWSGRPTS